MRGPKAHKNPSDEVQKVSAPDLSAPETVSIREFARLDGCNEKLVRLAINDGKLPVSADGRLDPALAGTGWRKSNRRAPKRADKAVPAPEMSAPPKPSAPRTKRGAKSAADAAAAIVADAEAMGDEDFIAEVLAGRFLTTGDAERVKENALAATRLLTMRREAGDLVDLEVAEAVLFEQAREFRDAWTNWPVRVGPLIAAQLGVATDPVVEALSEHVTQLLQDLGEPDPAFDGSEQG